MTVGSILIAALVALIAGVLVGFIGSIFDRTSDNRYAWIAGGVVALLVFIGRIGLL